ncbi:MAG: hypothetical protein BroJett011_40660 [Chloroflexota bacterium]|nr:MAG: hypothetical protein BroJett011_40660 [Chloroflexota bacterium]
MWILNQTEDTLINLGTGLRIVVMPTNTKQGEQPLYGVIVQAPAEATQPLGRPLPSGFSNTVLMHGAPLADCQNLLAEFCRRLEAYKVKPLPILPPDEDDDICYYVEIKGEMTHRFVADDEETANVLVYRYVEQHWVPAFGPREKKPDDRAEAIERYFERMKGKEDYRYVLTSFIEREDLRRIYPEGMS